MAREIEWNLGASLRYSQEGQ